MEHLKSKCDKDIAQQLVDKTDTLFLKYTTRTPITTKKSTKRLKRLHTTDTPHKHTNSQATNTATTPDWNKIPPKSNIQKQHHTTHTFQDTPKLNLPYPQQITLIIKPDIHPKLLHPLDMIHTTQPCKRYK